MLREWYPNWYYTRKDAQNFIDDAANNTYSCLGPFQIELDGRGGLSFINVAELIGAVVKDAVMEKFAEVSSP